MDCSCVYVNIDCYPGFTRDSMRKSKKIHKCGECDREIQKGEVYEYNVGLWDGDFSTNKTCIDCLSIRNVYFCDGWVYGSIWEDLWEHIRDCFGEVLGDSVLELTPRARAKFCDLVEEYWEYYCDEEEEDTK